ncbi:MAG: DUF4231 domain-containing protein [Dehalococcoidia bacterium]
MSSTDAAPDTCPPFSHQEQSSARPPATHSGPVHRSPPPARLTVRVGVAGHRPNRLQESDDSLLRANVRAALTLAARAARDVRSQSGDAYASGPACLRVISPLAEGADRIVAEEGLKLGFELQCILPFDRDAYEEDFESTHSRAQYRNLLDHSTSVLELDGSREPGAARDQAYEAAGRMVLLHCDLLVVIWDREPARGRGGTAQIVDEALQRGIPTLWMDSQAPHRLAALAHELDQPPRDIDLDRPIDTLIASLLPSAGDTAPAGRPDLRRTYFAERQPHSLLPAGWIWGVFWNLMLLRPRLPALRVPSFQRHAEAEWRREWLAQPALPPAVTAWFDTGLRGYYAWADGLASYYANMYRSAFVLNYFLAVTAVLLALFGREFVKTLIAIAIILLILVNTEIGRRRRWHERWIDYRMLAESLRQFRFLALLGRLPPFSRPPAHSAYGDPTDSWMMWHLRAVERQVGIVSARFDAGYIEACRVLMLDVLVGGQVAYHRESARRLATLDRRLRRLGVTTYAGVLVALLALLFVRSGWLTTAEAVLPALGAALAAIRGQAEVERLVKRSRAMSRQLERYAAELEQLAPAPSAAAVARIAESAAETMISENLDWRVVFQERPLDLPR